MNTNDRINALVEENTRLKQQLSDIQSSYGDNWYDGYIAARNDQRELSHGSIADYSDTEILQMSEAAESERLRAAKTQSNEVAA